MLVKLILKNVKKNIGIGILAIITLFIVIFSFTILDFIYQNIQRLRVEESLWSSKNKIIITKEYGWLLKKLITKNKLEQIYDKIKNDKNIEKSYAFYSTKIPTSATIKFLWFDFYTDVFVYATDKFSDTGDVLNLWISSTLLNIYNTQLSNDSLFPKLNKDLLWNIDIELSFWKNSFFTLKNHIEKKWKIKYVDNDFPLFGFTIAKNQIEQIEKKLWINTLKIYKIIVFVKDPKYINQLKKKYPNVKIQWYNDIVQKINQKLKSIRYIFNIIKFIIYTILLAFIIVLCMLILHKNKNNIKVLYYHGASQFKQFSIVAGEISLYSLLALFISLISVFIINQKIPSINHSLEKKWLINISLSKVSYSRTILITIFLYLTLILISYGLFINNSRKWEQI